MIVTHLRLRNWRNFLNVSVDLGDRVFIVGPNASGKSNLLDAFRFLRDIAKPGGGLQKSVETRGGVSKIRCLAARTPSNIEVEVHLADNLGEPATWVYAISIVQQPRGYRQPILRYERVWEGKNLLVNRPNEDDIRDEMRLTQTHLEQINSNQRFREIARFFDSIQYMHLVPQLLRHPTAFVGPGVPDDPFGRNFLDLVAKTTEKTRRSRLKRIERALSKAVPQFEELIDVKDETGIPHLEARYSLWRSRGARQREDQFSDGTLRLIGLFWSLLDGDSTLLLEEPELSLNAAVVRELPSLMYEAQKGKRSRRQIILSTHSVDLLSDRGIGAEEVLLLVPPRTGTDREATEAKPASSIDEIRDLMENGLSVGEAILPHAEPQNVRQMSLLQ